MSDPREYRVPLGPLVPELLETLVQQVPPEIRGLPGQLVKKVKRELLERPALVALLERMEDLGKRDLLDRKAVQVTLESRVRQVMWEVLVPLEKLVKQEDLSQDQRAQQEEQEQQEILDLLYRVRLEQPVPPEIPEYLVQSGQLDRPEQE